MPICFTPLKLLKLASLLFYFNFSQSNYSLLNLVSIISGHTVSVITLNWDKNWCLCGKNCDTLSKIGAFETNVGELESKFSGNDYKSCKSTTVLETVWVDSNSLHRRVRFDSNSDLAHPLLDIWVEIGSWNESYDHPIITLIYITLHANQQNNSFLLRLDSLLPSPLRICFLFIRWKPDYYSC